MFAAVAAGSPRTISLGRTELSPKVDAQPFRRQIATVRRTTGITLQSIRSRNAFLDLFEWTVRQTQFWRRRSNCLKIKFAKKRHAVCLLSQRRLGRYSSCQSTTAAREKKRRAKASGDSSLRFCNPPTPQPVRRDAGKVRLEVKNGRSVQHVDSSHMQRAVLTLQQFHDGKADRVRTTW
jgi:hypothetical protein